MVALRVSCFVVRQHDESVNACGGVGLDAASAERADGRHADFQLTQFAWASVLFSHLSQTVYMLFRLLHS